MVNFMNNPKEIEERSHEIINSEVGDLGLGFGERKIVTRIIHATGDLDYANLVVIHPGLVQAATSALKQGANIITDVEMVRNGISSKLLARGGGQVLCAIRDKEVADKAKATGETRAMIAMDHLASSMSGSIIAIGNAPTALFRLLQLIESGKVNPAAIIGTPVGFVGAAESKTLLEKSNVPYVTVCGPKGGSSVAVAAVNALLHLVWDKEDISRG
ncbi:MAG: precorrin-8X/cobalt-precorrin-8 methylmutase [Clostridia bacterium]|nr:precorrin-8X/cobalt-precorrin-8 methylmutase [Clostridia bacterium]